VSFTLASTANGFTFAPDTPREDRRIARLASLLNPSFNREDTFHANRPAFVNLDSLSWEEATAGRKLKFEVDVRGLAPREFVCCLYRLRCRKKEVSTD